MSLFSYAAAQCSTPLTYRTGRLDPEFGLTHYEFQQSLLKAEKMWEHSVGRDLFKLTDRGSIIINLIYTDAQARVDLTRENNKKVSYLNSEIMTLNEQNRSYEKNVDEYHRLLDDYNGRLEDFNEDVRQWNSGNKTSRQFLATLKIREGKLDRFREDLGSMRGKLDRQRSVIMTSKNYLDKRRGEIGSEMKHSLFGDKNLFEKAGEFRSTGSSRMINIFTVHDERQLITVLAHELGHALGLNHTSVPASIMYEAQTENNYHLSSVTAVDVNEFNEVCNKTHLKNF